MARYKSAGFWYGIRRRYTINLGEIVPKDDNRQYIIEYVQVGNSIKVSAIDPVSRFEACVVVPATGISRKEMGQLAIRKLEYVMEKAEG